MEDEIIIEFSRTKDDTKKIVLRKLWLKQIFPNIIIGSVLIHASYLVGLIMGVAICLTLGFNESSHIFFTIFMTMVILNFFLSPVYKLYFLYKKQINEIYKNHEILHNVFRIYGDRFKYENETFSLDTSWNNTSTVKIDNDFIHFQTLVPKIFIWIPTSQISHEVKNHLLTKISKR